MTESEEERFITRREVARLFHVSASTVSRWARHNRLPHVLTLGGHRRYRRDDVLRLLETESKVKSAQ